MQEKPNAVDAKRELARKLMRGNGVEKNEEKAVALLEECVALGDTQAMLMLAKWCALGCGMEQNAARAETLISEAGMKGDQDALSLMSVLRSRQGMDDAETRCL